MRLIRIIFFIILSVALFEKTYSIIWFDFEFGAVFTGYNDVRIPSDAGTKFSLKDDIKSDNSSFYRIRGGYEFGKNEIFFLVAPLRVKGDGILDRDINFNGKLFYSNSYVKSYFKFDSYRVSYRYNLYSDDILFFKIGATAKIRDASIKIEDYTGSSQRSNIGFVPLINVFLKLYFFNNMGFVLEGDGLIAPQGRAEDFFTGFFYELNNNFSVRIGYRILEGGSDGGGNVYTFSMFHYFGVGLIFIF